MGQQHTAYASRCMCAPAAKTGDIDIYIEINVVRKPQQRRGGSHRRRRPAILQARGTAPAATDAPQQPWPHPEPLARPRQRSGNAGAGAEAFPAAAAAPRIVRAGDAEVAECLPMPADDWSAAADAGDGEARPDVHDAALFAAAVVGLAPASALQAAAAGQGARRWETTLRQRRRAAARRRREAGVEGEGPARSRR